MDVNRWAAEVPPVETCRPAGCPSCGIGSRPVGEPLRLHGHGLIARQFWGPRGADTSEPAKIVEILLRRFLCTACGAVTTVGPRGMLDQKWYHGTAIAFALALWALDLLSIGAVRRRVSPWKFQGWSVNGRWASLKRWIAELLDGRLWRPVGASAAVATDRRAVAGALVRLAAHASTARLGSVDSATIFLAAAQIRGGPSIG